MQLLIIHNSYGAYSGEEAVVDSQVALFRELGYGVSEYRKTTEGVRGTLSGNVKALFQGFYSSSSLQDIRYILNVYKPDVVIVHNLFPFISPAVLKIVYDTHTPIIMTVHNYRLICPNGLFMRQSKPCELCLKKRNERSCIRYNCERSFFKSLGYAGRSWYARVTKAYKNHVDIYACITQFQIKKLVEAGYPSSRIKHIPNFVSRTIEPYYASGNYVAVSGRINREKGIDLIVSIARKTPHICYVFAGRVCEEDKGLIMNAPANCSFLGYLSSDKLSAFYKNARFLLMASRCYEGFPMVVLDASMYGKAAIVPAHGGFTEIVDNEETGLYFVSEDTIDLQAKVEQLWNNPELSMQMGKKAYQKLCTHYTAEVVKAKWKDLLDEVVGRKQ